MKQNKIIKELNKFAVPLVIQSLASYFLIFGDQALIGHVSILAYGAVGVVYAFFSMLAGILGCITIVLNIRAGKLLGSKDSQRFNDEMSSSLLLSLYIGIIFIFILNVFCKTIIVDMYGLSGEMQTVGDSYFRIMSPYLVLQLLLFAFGTRLKLKQQTKWIMIGSLVSNVLDFSIDYILLFGKLGFFKMDVSVAAISTIFSMFVNLIIYIWICREDIKIQIHRLRLYHQLMIQHIKESVPLIGQELLEGSIFIVAINAIIIRIGVLELTAFLMIRQIIGLIEMPMHMYGAATLTLVSKNYGAKNLKNIKKYLNYSVGISYCLWFILAIIVVACKEYIPQIITSNVETQRYASQLLVSMILTYCTVPFVTIYANALRALGKSTFILYSTAIINTIVLIIMLLMAEVLHFGIVGMMTCLFINYVSMAIAYRYQYTKKLTSIKTEI